MDTPLYVEIDLDRLRANLSSEDRRAISVEELMAWLRDAGFTRAGDGWVARERDLGQLDFDSEVRLVDDWPRPVKKTPALAR